MVKELEIGQADGMMMLQVISDDVDSREDILSVYGSRVNEREASGWSRVRFAS